MIFNPLLGDIQSYEAGKPIEFVLREYGINVDDIIKLASNENPHGCSLSVKNVVKDGVDNMSMYPDDSMYELKEALANKYNLLDTNIIIGAGSDQIIDFCIRAKCSNKSTILTAGITFAMYDIYAKMIGCRVIKTKSNTHNLDEFLELYQQNSVDLIFLCLPNNPLGDSLDIKDVYQFLDMIDDNTLVVIDGAYQEYAKIKDDKKSINIKKLVSKYKNVIYTGTFSKAYGLGGMRCGYGISCDLNIKALHKLRPPFNITTLTLKASIAALQDVEFVENSVIDSFKEMIRFEEFAENHGIKYIDSYTNFITLLLPKEKSSADISSKLLKKGIIIRDLSAYKINAIRITIGTNKQNSIVLKELEEIQKEQN
jgi:histidinol-phosphate aminotransferase